MFLHKVILNWLYWYKQNIMSIIGRSTMWSIFFHYYVFVLLFCSHTNTWLGRWIVKLQLILFCCLSILLTQHNMLSLVFFAFHYFCCWWMFSFLSIILTYIVNDTMRNEWHCRETVKHYWFSIQKFTLFIRKLMREKNYAITFFLFSS